MVTASQILTAGLAGNFILIVIAFYFIHQKKHFIGGLTLAILGVSLTALETGIPGIGNYLFAPVVLLWAIGIYYMVKGIYEGSIM